MEEKKESPMQGLQSGKDHEQDTENLGISLADIEKHLHEVSEKFISVEHNEILDLILGEIDLVDFFNEAFPDAEKLLDRKNELDTFDTLNREEKAELKKVEQQLSRFRLKENHFLIICVQKILEVAQREKWGLAKNNGFIYSYNGEYWKALEKEALEKFLGKAAEQMGIEKYLARYYLFIEKLLKQFLSTAYLPKPQRESGKILINLKNGTFQIVGKDRELRPFLRTDFLTYQLPFAFDPEATAPIFQRYLDQVLPEKALQDILAEYLGYLFIPSNDLKLEKALMLFGDGANGKSVFYEVANALLGFENVSSYSIQNLTDETGYYRAQIADKLLNYASEINGKLEASIFKQLVSGEPVPARLPYQDPFILTDYAKLIFNCNELPRDVEHTNAYFRRFLIVPFSVTIPEHEQDKELAKKIIDGELAGVFNWVLAGLDRLMENKKFTYSEAVEQVAKDYRKQSDSAQMFMSENEYTPDINEEIPLKYLYDDYRAFCADDGFKPLSKANFSKRLQSVGYAIQRKKTGMVVFARKVQF